MTTPEILRRNPIPNLPPFDTDLAGLYKPERQVELLSKKVRFFAPSFEQMALFHEFIVLGLQDSVSTAQERQDMEKADLHEKCRLKLAWAATATGLSAVEEVEQKKVLGRMFMSVEGNRCFLDLISQCFPDLANPEWLTEEAKFAAFQILTTLIDLRDQE
jgi:hypothetical protein